MKLIVGLGNIGGTYDGTYHNIGFSFIDELVWRYDIKNFKRKKFCFFAKSKIDGIDVVLVKPTTFMNLSGNAVVEMQNFFKATNKDTIIVLDDVDIERGKIRFRENGSAGTHNGLKHIVDLVGADIPRLRIGIGKDENMDLADYVLSKIDAEQKAVFKASIDSGIKKILEIIKK